MRNLLNFLFNNAAWILFLLLQLLCSMLVFYNNPFQRTVLLSSANSVTGCVYESANTVSNFFYLSEQNKRLLQENALLQNELLLLKKSLQEQQATSILIDSFSTILQKDSSPDIIAEVINNSLVLRNNYITLNKGSKDGIEKEMGIVNEKGVVGIICMVSEHRSVAISLLNSLSHISCKVLNDQSLGSLQWNGLDSEIGQLVELPNYAKYNVGDSIVTSGFSAIFPAGMFVGTVKSMQEGSTNFNSVSVKFAVDFGRLHFVRILKKRPYKEEQKKIEQKTELL